MVYALYCNIAARQWEPCGCQYRHSTWNMTEERGSLEGADTMSTCDSCQQTSRPVVELDEVTQDSLIHAVLERGLVVPGRLNNALLRPHAVLCDLCAEKLNEWIDRFNVMQAYYGA